ncbi:MAG: hypothetical protein ACRCWQ_04795 [Bacilli bacterium]
MRRLVIIAVTILIVLAVIQDVRGVVLKQPTQKQELQIPQSNALPFKTMRVASGQTVLSIVSTLNENATPASIQRIVADFEKLNPSISANEIVDGVIYKFPLYAMGE